MKFSIGAIDFEISARRSKIQKEVAAVYAKNINNRVEAIKCYRSLTQAHLRDAIIYCNENIFSYEDRVKSVSK